MKLFDDLLAAGEELGAIRRDLHRHPELCFNELRTSELIAARLTEWGIPVIRGLGQDRRGGRGEERQLGRARWDCAPTSTRCR
jgi:metal-dependent amidase/aminoacylase/carboxypeptidase family protein